MLLWRFEALRLRVWGKGEEGVVVKSSFGVSRSKAIDHCWVMQALAISSVEEFIVSVFDEVQVQIEHQLEHDSLCLCIRLIRHNFFQKRNVFA